MSSTLKKLSVFAITLLLAFGTMMLVACSDNSSSNTNNSSKASNSENAQNSNKNSNSNQNSNKNSNKNANSNKNSDASYIKSVSEDDEYASGTHHATVTVEGYEPFVIELDADNAPISVSNFCKLANDGFYDGLTFYRFQDEFCMQGGSSNNGTAIVDDGLSAIKGEFSSNNVKNKLADKFKKGTVAMARSSDPNSATSTFFVTLSSGTMVGQSLNGQYAAFGTIDEDGMKVVDQIVADHVEAAVSDPSGMGVIADLDKQAKIDSIKITD